MKVTSFVSSPSNNKRIVSSVFNSYRRNNQFTCPGGDCYTGSSTRPCCTIRCKGLGCVCARPTMSAGHNTASISGKIPCYSFSTRTRVKLIIKSSSTTNTTTRIELGNRHSRATTRGTSYRNIRCIYNPRKNNSVSEGTYGMRRIRVRRVGISLVYASICSIKHPSRLGVRRKAGKDHQHGADEQADNQPVRIEGQCPCHTHRLSIPVQDLKNRLFMSGWCQILIFDYDTHGAYRGRPTRGVFRASPACSEPLRPI